METSRQCEVCGHILQKNNKIGICTTNEICAKLNHKKNHDINKIRDLKANREWYNLNRDRDLATGNAWRRANKEHVAEVRRRHYASLTPDQRRDIELHKKYGITLNQYKDILFSQGGSCAICKSEESRREDCPNLLVDHSHGSKIVRGLLCHLCNIMVSEHFELYGEAGIVYLNKVSSNLPDDNLPSNSVLAKRDKKLVERYGITSWQFDSMLKTQDGACAICKTSNPLGLRNRFQVDHSHDSGKVRGLLCYACNKMVSRHFEQFAQVGMIYLGVVKEKHNGS